MGKKHSAISFYDLKTESLRYLSDDEQTLIKQYRKLYTDDQDKLKQWISQQNKYPADLIQSSDEVNHALAFGYQKTAFDEGRKLATMRAFIYANQHNIPIPPWCLQHFNTVLKSYVASNCTTDLNQALGEKSKASGQTLETRKERIGQRDTFAFERLCASRHADNPITGKKCTLEWAYVIVAKWIANCADDYGWTPVSAKTLESYWKKRKWGSLCKKLSKSAELAKLNDHPFINPKFFFSELKFDFTKRQN